MKKIAIAVVAILSATILNAATCKWSASAIVGTNGSNAGSTYTAYIFAASDSSSTVNCLSIDAALAAIAKGDVSGALTSKTLMSGMIANATVTKDGWVADTTISTYAIVLDSAPSSASKYVLVGPASKTFSDPDETATVAFGQVKNVVGDWKSVSGTAAPEPTSGLLLLLGMAGLALKRKYA